MKFDAVEAVLTAWAQSNGLEMQREYRGEEVRSLEVADRTRRYQIWIDPPQPGHLVHIHAWDFGRHRFDVSVPPLELGAALSAALDQVHVWRDDARKTP